MTPDIDSVAALIRAAAQEHIMPFFEKLEVGQIEEKGPGDLVTIADLRTEQALAPVLTALVPGSTVVGEEASAKDPAIFDRLGGEGDVWLIDPVDGTANFAAGLPLFACMVAFIRRGEIVASWIHDPVKDIMAVAATEAGAWIDGKRIAVAPPVETGQMSGSVTLRFGNRQLVRKIAGRSNLVGSVFSFRCAGQEYLALSTGRTHFALYHRLLPWDHAPGYLLHREAGGFGRRLDRSAYSPRVRDGGLLLTPDEESWEALHAALIGK
jgi:fructose-1,6-bisphosphatase/inositol monophosphatase family enzyme